MAVVATAASHMPAAALSCRAATSCSSSSSSNNSQFQRRVAVKLVISRRVGGGQQHHRPLQQQFSGDPPPVATCLSRLVLRRRSSWNPRRQQQHFFHRTTTTTRDGKRAASRIVTTTSCEAAGRGFDDDRLGKIAAEARRRASDAARAVSAKAEDVFNDVKRRTLEFQEKNDVKGKAQRAARNANLRLEELAFDLKRKVAKWDREYGVSDRARQVADFAAEQVQNVDRQLGIRQKARNATTDLRLKWPTYRKQFNAFLETPLGKSVVTLFMVWFLVSGWAFRIFFFSLWFLPFAGPFLLGTLSKAAIVEGACPNCGARYIGGRNQVVMCQQCKGVVWQPRQDFSKKDKQDPTIIDIDIDEN